MKIEQTDDGWIVRVPNAIVEVLGLRDGVRVTLRPFPRQKDEIRHAIAQTRGRLSDYPFDREDWNGKDVAAIDETIS